MERRKFIDTFVSSEDRGIYSLFGPAGSGKSTCIVDIMVDIYRDDEDADIKVLTPTHAAKNRLKEDGVESETIHSFLGIHPEINFFEKDIDNASTDISVSKEDIVDIIIVDEFSMASEQMLTQLYHRCNKLLLVGDTAQLPPVKAVGMDKEVVEKASVISYTLTKIYRATDPLIVDRCTKCREFGGVSADVSVDRLRYEFVEDACEDKIYVAYTNQEVETVSEMLGSTPKSGLFMIAHSGFQFWTKEGFRYDALFNGDLVEIEEILTCMPSFGSKMHTPFNLRDFPQLQKDEKYFVAKMKGINIPFVHCYLGSEKSFKAKYKEPVFQEVKTLSEQLHTKYELGGNTPYSKNKALWDAYSAQEISRADINALRGAYARFKKINNVLIGNDARVSTVHKAQGRGFDHVYANIKGMDSQQKYVAITRAKKQLIVGA